MLSDIPDDILGRGAWEEDLGYPLGLQIGYVLGGDDPADKYERIVHPVFAEEVHYARTEGLMCTAEDGYAHGVHVFLQRGCCDHLGGLAEPGVDHFHTGVA